MKNLKCNLENSPFKNPNFKGDEFDMLYYWESWFMCLEEELKERLKSNEEIEIGKEYLICQIDFIKELLGVS